MNKQIKGTLCFSTNSNFYIKTNMLCNNLNAEIIKSDLIKAAKDTEFKSIDGSDIEFNFNGEENVIENNVDIKKFNFSMINFSGISFVDSFKDAPIERQNAFKSWSKFWSHLSKFGYKIK